MSVEDSHRVWTRVDRVVARGKGFDLHAWLVPEPDGPHIMLDLHNPPRELEDVIRVGARVACQTKQRGPVCKAFWIHEVQHENDAGEWTTAWRAAKPFVPRSLSKESRRPAQPAAVPQPGEHVVTGIVTRVERLFGRRTVGTIFPDDEGSLVDMQLRRAPFGLLSVLTPGARVECIAVPHAKDPCLRFTARVLSIQLPVGGGNFREAWNHEQPVGAGSSPRTSTRTTDRRPATDCDPLHLHLVEV